MAVATETSGGADTRRRTQRPYFGRADRGRHLQTLHAGGRPKHYLGEKDLPLFAPYIVLDARAADF